MLNKKKIAIAATGIVIMICGVLVYVNFINKEPAYDYTSVPETTITKQYQEVDKGITIILPDSEPVFIEEPVIDWEEPPVVTVYNPIADINNDGHVDNVEWEKWVADNPADLNQDLYVEDWELEEFNKPTQEEQKPVEQTKPTETKPVESKPVETKPVETKPTESKPVEKPTPPTTDTEGSSTGGGSFTDDFLDNWGSDVEGKGSVDDYHKPFDPIQ